MKPAIHPKWTHNATVTCGCGNTFLTGSTNDSIQVDVCSACHPFYTGKMKFLDTQGRVERFTSKRTAAQKNPVSKKSKNQDKSDVASLSLREMLEVEKKKAVAEETKAPKAKTN